MRLTILLLMTQLSLTLAATTEAAPVLVRWTAPYDSVGVVEYDLRYSTAESDTNNMDAWWGQATRVPSMPLPNPVGATDSVRVELPSGTYYFNIVSYDAARNRSDYSNVAIAYVPDLPDTTPPAAVRDLRIEVDVFPNPNQGSFFR